MKKLALLLSILLILSMAFTSVLATENNSEEGSDGIAPVSSGEVVESTESGEDVPMSGEIISGENISGEIVNDTTPVSGETATQPDTTETAQSSSNNSAIVGAIIAIAIVIAVVVIAAILHKD